MNYDHLCPPCTAGDIKIGDVVLLKGRPCKIVNLTKSKTGKHGSAKCKMDGLCVLTGQKFCEVEPAHQKMRYAVVQDGSYMLCYANARTKQLSLLDDNGATYEYDVHEKEEELFQQLLDENDHECISITLKRAPVLMKEDITVQEHFVNYKHVGGQ